MTRVLVVDDSATIRGILAKALGERGYDVRTASDGVEAIEALASSPVDVAVLDVKMPRLDGYEVCRILREERNDHTTRIVFLTSLAGKDDRAWGLGQGGDAYLAKPVAPEALAAEIERLLAGGPNDGRQGGGGSATGGHGCGT